MADQIDFTPAPTSADPTPSPLVFNPKRILPATGLLTDSVFSTVRGALIRATEQVNIPYTDIGFVRTTGRVSRLYVVTGTDTFDDKTDAQDQLEIIEQMSAAECTITSADYDDDTFDVDCLNIGSPEIVRKSYPGFHIHYRLIFLEFPT